jgi:hypothetical protein
MRSDGQESLLLIVPLRSISGDFNSLGLAVALAMMDLFSRTLRIVRITLTLIETTFWARDVLLLIADGDVGVRSFMDDYHSGLIYSGGSLFSRKRSSSIPRRSHPSGPLLGFWLFKNGFAFARYARFVYHYAQSYVLSRGRLRTAAEFGFD